MAVQSISVLNQRTYEANLRSLSQQRGSKLRQFTIERHEPNMHLWDRIAQLPFGATGLNARVSGGATPEVQATIDRRRTTPAAYDVGHLVDPDDVANVTLDPKSAILQEQANVIGRKFDDIIITAALGATLAEDGTSTAFPTATQSLGSATQPFDFNFITSVNEKFWVNNVPTDEEKVFVIRPNGAKKLLQMTQATSSDYVMAQALASTGYVENWLGYTWIVSNLLPNVAGLQYYYLAMTKRAMGLHITKDIWSRVSESTEKSFAWRVYSAFSAGAVRIEDEHVVRAWVLES
jgi:hypothetical protein